VERGKDKAPGRAGAKAERKAQDVTVIVPPNPDTGTRTGKGFSRELSRMVKTLTGLRDNIRSGKFKSCCPV
jgi:hypothetical protein